MTTQRDSEGTLCL